MHPGKITWIAIGCLVGGSAAFWAVKTCFRNSGVGAASSKKIIVERETPLPMEVVLRHKKGNPFEAAHHLSRSLSAQDIDNLYHFLRDKKNTCFALKNELMTALRDQKKAPPGLTALFLELYRDPEQNPVIRDYALQHLCLWYEQVADGEKSQIEQALWDALNEKQTSIAGTALVALAHLSEKNPQLDSGKVKDAALQLANDPACGELARITALQVCGNLGAKEILPVALDLAKNSQDTPLRISAIAALGEVGGREVQPLLKKLSKNSNTLLQLAAQAALQKIRNRAPNA